MSSKADEVFEFFSRLQSHIEKNLSPNSKVVQSVEEVVTDAKESTDRRHMAFPEGAFLNTYIAPAIHSFLVSELKLTEGEARHALLSESYRSIPTIASASPARSKSHPFQKALGAKSQDIASRWMDASKGSSLIQSCPDLALREPAPVNSIIEGKYFVEGSLPVAAKELAMDIYQSFFYLALSKVEETKTHPAWNYDFSCLIAYDGSPQGTLKEAWNNQVPDVREGIWDGANIYVMLLRGDT